MKLISLWPHGNSYSVYICNGVHKPGNQLSVFFRSWVKADSDWLTRSVSNIVKANSKNAGSNSQQEKDIERTLDRWNWQTSNIVLLAIPHINWYLIQFIVLAELYYFAPGGDWSIAISTTVCSHISKNDIQTSRNFLYMLSMAVAPFSSDDNAVSYVPCFRFFGWHHVFT